MTQALIRVVTESPAAVRGAAEPHRRVCLYGLPMCWPPTNGQLR